jgi:lysozyme family protein
MEVLIDDLRVITTVFTTRWSWFRVFLEGYGGKQPLFLYINERDYWSNAYAKIESQAVANKVFDMAVNMGHSQAHKITQRACLDCGHTVSVDGFLGEKTLAAVNSIPETNLLMAIKARAGSFYRDLAASKPSNVQFLKGWLARANA